jgi:nitrous oxidase accessory protein
MITRNSLLCILFSFACLCAAGRTIPVGPGERIRSIKEAIALAADNDTLIIRKSTYREGNIILQKPLTLIGETGAVLDGENKYEILTIHARYVTIQGLTFINTGIASMEDIAAIKILQSSGIRLVGNQFQNTFFGIYLANSNNCHIEGNEMRSLATAEHQIGNGIHLWKCDRITIHQNKVTGHRDGIYFEFVTNSVISENHSERNLRYGLHFMFSHNDEYRNNTFLDNGAGVAVMYTKGVKMIDNNFQHNWGSSSYGLLLKDIRDSEITGNRFIENSVGIFMEGSSRNQFKRNEFTRNGYAIKLQASCDDNVMTENNFKQNTFDLVTNGSLVLNTIDSNYWDRYEGYDLNRDDTGDVPYRPISLYGMIVERMPTAVLLWRSFLVFLLDRAERAIPVITPENLKDNSPAMKPYDFN